MKKWVLIAFLSSFVSVGLQGYLSKRSYELMAGKASSSAVCNISAKVNCDSALLSPYAKVFNISVSNFGVSFNLALSFLLFLFLFGLFSSKLWRTSFVYLSGLLVLTSLTFMLIALAEDIYCPLCWSSYLASFITFGVLLLAFRRDVFSQKITSFVKEAWSQKHLIGFFIFVLGAALFLHIMFMDRFDIKNQSKQFKALFLDWQADQVMEWDTPPLLSSGPKDAKMTLVEFADFTCPSCKRFTSEVKRFLETHKDVQFYFYAYPLDKVCNKGMSHARGGLACKLAKVAICGANQNKAWLIHDKIFERQTSFLKARTHASKVQKWIQEIVKEAELDETLFNSCMKSPETQKTLLAQTALGARARVDGTPTFFVNGKVLILTPNLSAFLNYLYAFISK